MKEVNELCVEEHRRRTKERSATPQKITFHKTMTTETTATETAETKAVTEVEADSVVAATTTVEDSPKEDDPTTGVADETAPTLERDERTILDSDAPFGSDTGKRRTDDSRF